MTIVERTAVAVRAKDGTRGALRLSTALAVVVFAAGSLTFFGDVLTGPPVMDGSARGTALVMFLAAVPMLLLAGRRTANGSRRWLFVWAGMSMFLTYNTFMLLAGTPINRLFLLYVTAFGLAVATMIAIARSVDVREVVSGIDAALPVRLVAGYLGAVVLLNALAWLGRIVPAMVNDTVPDLVEGMGIATVPTYLQDLAFWLPLVGLGAWLLWQRRDWGYVISGAALAFWTLEAVTVAVDQWFGHRADPASDVASDVMVLPFGALAVIGAVVLWSFLSHVSREGAL
jgi:hypothetical protein